MDNLSGKIAPDLFHGVIQTKLGMHREALTVPPAFGVDVAVVDLPGGNAMVLASDPLSLIPSIGLQESAWLSVQLMVNDIATTGFAPMFGQFVLNLPADFSKADFETYWHYIHTFCKDAGIAITGGHTGFIEGQNSTISGAGTLVSIAPRDRVLVSSMAKPGDTILVTKTCAISSSAILALSFPETVKSKAGNEIYSLARESFYHTSSLRDALVAVGEGNENEVTAMHDVTEGGVLGAIYELAIASGNGALVDYEKIPVAPVQQKVCEIFGLDPRYCIGAGSMLITCKKGYAQSVMSRLDKADIACVEAGVITEKQKGIKIARNGKTEEMKYYESDPYWAAFYQAMKMNWR